MSITTTTTITTSMIPHSPREDKEPVFPETITACNENPLPFLVYSEHEELYNAVQALVKCGSLDSMLITDPIKRDPKNTGQIDRAFGSCLCRIVGLWRNNSTASSLSSKDIKELYALFSEFCDKNDCAIPDSSPYIVLYIAILLLWDEDAYSDCLSYHLSDLIDRDGLEATQEKMPRERSNMDDEDAILHKICPALGTKPLTNTTTTTTTTTTVTTCSIRSLTPSLPDQQRVKTLLFLQNARVLTDEKPVPVEVLSENVQSCQARQTMAAFNSSACIPFMSATGALVNKRLLPNSHHPRRVLTSQLFATTNPLRVNRADISFLSASHLRNMANTSYIQLSHGRAGSNQRSLLASTDPQIQDSPIASPTSSAHHQVVETSCYGRIITWIQAFKDAIIEIFRRVFSLCKTSTNAPNPVQEPDVEEYSSNDSLAPTTAHRAITNAPNPAVQEPDVEEYSSNDSLAPTARHRARVERALQHLASQSSPTTFPSVFNPVQQKSILPSGG